MLCVSNKYLLMRRFKTFPTLSQYRSTLIQPNEEAICQYNAAIARLIIVDTTKLEEEREMMRFSHFDRRLYLVYDVIFESDE